MEVKKIFIKITPYTMEDVEFNHLCLSTCYRKGYGFYYSITPCGVDGYRTIMVPCSPNICVSGLRGQVIPASRYSKKTHEKLHAELMARADEIADLWNNRESDNINL